MPRHSTISPNERSGVSATACSLLTNGQGGRERESQKERKSAELLQDPNTNTDTSPSRPYYYCLPRLPQRTQRLRSASSRGRRSLKWRSPICSGNNTAPRWLRMNAHLGLLVRSLASFLIGFAQFERTLRHSLVDHLPSKGVQSCAVCRLRFMLRALQFKSSENKANDMWPVIPHLLNMQRKLQSGGYSATWLLLCTHAQCRRDPLVVDHRLCLYIRSFNLCSYHLSMRAAAFVAPPQASHRLRIEPRAA